jgi:outer membrane protein
MFLSARRSGILRAAWKPGSMLLCLAVGCSHRTCFSSQELAGRVLPPPEVVQASVQPETPAAAERSSNEETPTGQAPAAEGVAGTTLTLPDAIAMAFRLQPRLRASLESIAQAQGKEDIAFAAFLPVASAAYSGGGFNLDAGGAGVPLPNSPPFTFLPFTGTVPIGLDIHTGYALAELKLQWLVCDFGRRLGRFNQAGIASDIAQLQTQRAYQTVANEVAVAYYQVLRARSLHRIAIESVRRGVDDLDVARKLAKGGVIEREKVLRAEVALAQARRAQDVAEEAEAIGLNVSAATGLVDTTEIPPFGQSLSECLQTAVISRREFQVARQSVRAAQEGTRVAKADFAPKIVAEGYLNDFQGSSPRDHANLALGFIRLEWGIFEGGKRVAELRVADSRVREALAQADSIADTIAFQVNQAYRQLVAARKSIDRSRPAVDQAQEAYRLVVARSRQGDATPAELTDAEASLTRAQQDYFNAVYDYLTAWERLQYAMGTTPSAMTNVQ